MESSLDELVKKLGKPYSEQLGIDVRRGEDDVFRWFLASLLLAKPIREETAMKTYRELEREGLTNPRSLIDAGWSRIVEILDRGGYVRYDFSTATKILEACHNLMENHGSLTALHDSAKDQADLERKIKSLAKGIGDVTVSIFLRDMRLVWKEVRERPTPLLELGMRAFRISNCDEAALLLGVNAVRLETALSRFAKEEKRRAARHNMPV